MHFHMHVIPRYEGGPKEIANWTPGSATAEELMEAAEKISTSVVIYDQMDG